MMMKGVRYYAFLGGLMLLALNPAASLADDKTSAGRGEKKPAVDETETRTERGITADQLFALPYGSKIPQAVQKAAQQGARSVKPTQVTHTLKVAPHHTGKSVAAAGQLKHPVQ